MLAGMAKAVADVDAESNQGGFTTENANVTGFSTMHDSGTGNSTFALQTSDDLVRTVPLVLSTPARHSLKDTEYSV
jgi:hypothetical protein